MGCRPSARAGALGALKTRTVGIFSLLAGQALVFSGGFEESLVIMDFAQDFEFNPYMLRGGEEDTQDYVVASTGFSK